MAKWNLGTQSQQKAAFRKLGEEVTTIYTFETWSAESRLKRQAIRHCVKGIQSAQKAGIPEMVQQLRGRLEGIIGSS